MDLIKICRAKYVVSGTWTLIRHLPSGEYLVVSYSRYTDEVIIWPALVASFFGFITDFAPNMPAGQSWQSDYGVSAEAVLNMLNSGKLVMHSSGGQEV